MKMGPSTWRTKRAYLMGPSRIKNTTPLLKCDKIFASKPKLTCSVWNRILPKERVQERIKWHNCESCENELASKLKFCLRWQVSWAFWNPSISRPYAKENMTLKIKYNRVEIPSVSPAFHLRCHFLLGYFDCLLQYKILSAYCMIYAQSKILPIL